MIMKRTATSAVLLVLALVLSTVPVVAQPNAPTISRVEPNPLELGKIGESIREQLKRKTKDEYVRIIIRLEPARVGGAEMEKVINALKAHAIGGQEQVLEMLRRRGARVLNTFWLANAILAEVRVGTIYELASIPNVWRIHEDYKVRILEPREKLTQTGGSGDNSNSGDNTTWGLARVRAPDVWAMGIQGDNIRVAVLDTGVEITHLDLVGKMWTDNAEDPYYPGGWIEFNSDGNIVENSKVRDTDGHGTHTSGTVLGGNASGTAIGVAPGAWLMHALILPGGSGKFAQIVAGMQWAIAPTDQFGNPAGQRADITSMSWGMSGHWNEFIEPIINMRVSGVVPVVAIGNDGEEISGSPGNVYEAFGIGATDNYDNVWWRSGGEVVDKTDWLDPPADWPSSYIKPDFSAPGVSVYSSVPGDNWENWNGTSMAAPHVAGTIALMLEANPTLTVDDIYVVLKSTSKDLGDPGKDARYGWGVINAFDAVRFNSGIQGYVVDSLTSEGIAGAKVTIKGTGRVRYTAENGYYRFFAPPDNYTLTVSAFGYFAENVAVSVIENQWTIEDITLDPLPRGFLTGVVTDNAHNPVDNATVSLLGTSLSTRADNAGSYALEAPIGSYNIKASAWGYESALIENIEVLENQTTFVNFRLKPAMRVAVLGDHRLQLTNLLRENDVSTREVGWEIISEIENYDVIVVNLPEDQGENTFRSLIGVADRHGVGLVFTSSWPAPSPHLEKDGRRWHYGISLLENYLGDPRGQSSIRLETLWRGVGDLVYYQVLSTHPIFAGWSVGDDISIISNGRLDYLDFAWFWGYSGDVMADIGSAYEGIMGSGVAFSIRENNRHVLLAGLAPHFLTNMLYWTNDAKTIFLRALQWASAFMPSDRDVFVSTSPKRMGGSPGITLTYDVNVKNIGTLEDIYYLTANDDLGWALTLSENRLENVLPG